MSRKLLVFCLLILTASASFAEQIKITKVEAKKIGNYNEVIVYTSENIKPEVILLDSPNRIAIAFPNSRIDSPVTIPGPSSMIRIIQALQFDENTVYVMVEPNEKLTYDYASIIGRNKFILELTAARPESAKIVAPSPEEKFFRASISATAEAEISAEAAIPITRIIKIPVIKPVKTEISKIVPMLKGKTIAIDPGHGGRDPGYVGRSGVLEKNLNLKIAMKLKKILTDAGAKVIMSREKDVSTKDKEIVNMANSGKADIFVSIHLNSYTSPRVGGSETFYYMPWSKKFASVMQKNISAALKRRDRGIKKVTYYTVHHTKMPSVLIEPVYLTNIKEEKLILTPEFQARVAYGIYKGITEYVKISPHGGNIPNKTGKAYNIGQSNAKGAGSIREDNAD